MLRILFITSLAACISIHAASQTAFQRANDCYREGKLHAALSLYNKALYDGASPALVFFNMGNAHYQMGNLGRAIGCYLSSIHESPDFFAGYLNLGILYHAREEWPSAVVIMEQARVLEPLNREVLLILAVAYKNLKAYGPAVECLTMALEEDSSLHDCYFLLYDIHQELGDWDEAQHFLQAYPDDGKRVDEKYRLLGNMAETHDDMEKASFYYGRQVQLAPGNRWARYKLVEATYRCGRALLALETAKSALLQFDKFAELALLAGNIAFETEYWSDAEALYAKAHRLGEARGLVGLQNLRKIRQKKNETL